MKKNNEEEVFEKLQAYMMGIASEPYSDKALTLAYEPLNVGEMKNPDGFGCIKGPCGDTMLIFLQIIDGKISEATFLTDGCGGTLACGSAITELAKGKTPYEAAKISPKAVIKYLDGLPASHLHCAVLAAQTLHKAFENVKETVKIPKKGKDNP